MFPSIPQKMHLFTLNHVLDFFFSDHETRVMLCVVVSSCEKGCFLSMKVNINSENNILILFLTSSLGHISNLEGERSAVFVGSKIRSSI